MLEQSAVGTALQEAKSITPVPSFASVWPPPGPVSTPSHGDSAGLHRGTRDNGTGTVTGQEVRAEPQLLAA